MAELRTLDEAAVILRVSRRTVYRLVADRQLSVVKVRRSSFVTIAELERYVKARQRLA